MFLLKDVFYECELLQSMNEVSEMIIIFLKHSFMWYMHQFLQLHPQDTSIQQMLYTFAVCPPLDMHFIRDIIGDNKPVGFFQ